MAISVFFRKINQSDQTAEYEVKSDPDDAEEIPVRVSLSADGGVTIADDAPLTIALHAAIRKILRRKATEGDWPGAGGVQS